MQFWFSAFRSVLSTLMQLPGVPADKMPAADWAMLSTSLPAGYTDAQAGELFYPGQEASTATRRRPDFLAMLGDDDYRKVYERIAGGRPRLRFVDVQSLLRTSREDGRVMVQVLGHVVAWLNPKPTQVHDKRDNNKPPLWKDLVPGLQACSEEQIRSGARRLRTEGDVPSGAEGAARLLQQEVLEFVRNNAAAFKGAATKQYLDRLPGAAGEPLYAQRFLDQAPWAGVLAMVRQYVGADFQPTWAASGSPRGAFADKPVSGLTRAICAASQTVPEVARNPALNTRHALEALGTLIDEAVLRWAAQQCEQALEKGSDSMGRAWPAETVRELRGPRRECEDRIDPPAGSEPKADESRSNSSRPRLEQQGSAAVGAAGVSAVEPPAGGRAQVREGSDGSRPQRRPLPPGWRLRAVEEDRQVVRDFPRRTPPRSSSPLPSSTGRGGMGTSQQGRNKQSPAWARGVKAKSRN